MDMGMGLGRDTVWFFVSDRPPIDRPTLAASRTAMRASAHNFSFDLNLYLFVLGGDPSSQQSASSACVALLLRLVAGPLELINLQFTYI